MDHGRALRLQADRDARAGEPRAVVGDERDVRDAADADEARLAASLPHALADGVEHVAVVEVGDRPANRVGERRPDRDDDLAPRRRHGPPTSPSDTIGSASADSPSSSAGTTTCGSDWRSSQRSPSSR